MTTHYVESGPLWVSPERLARHSSNHLTEQFNNLHLLVLATGCGYNRIHAHGRSVD
jgi:hypothetical protein